MGAEILRLPHGELVPSQVSNIYIRPDRGSVWPVFKSNGAPDCGLHQVGPSGDNYATAVEG